MVPHSSTLAWRIPWTEEPGRLLSMESRRARYDWATSLSPFTFMHWRRKWQPTPVFLPGESQGLGSMVGCPLWGLTESDMTHMRACCMLSHFSCVWLFASLWTEHCQAPLSMGFSGQESWSGLAFPPPGHLPDPEFKPVSVESSAMADGFFTSGATWEAQIAHPKADRHKCRS